MARCRSLTNEHAVVLHEVDDVLSALDERQYRPSSRPRAVYLQNSAAALPASDSAERALRRLRRESLEMDGSAMLVTCSALVGWPPVVEHVF